MFLELSLKNLRQKYFLRSKLQVIMYCFKIFIFSLYFFEKVKPDTKKFIKISVSAGSKQSALRRKVIMEDVMFKIKDKQSKWKKLNQFTSTALNSKVRTQISLECSNSSIYGSGANQEDYYVKKK